MVFRTLDFVTFDRGMLILSVRGVRVRRYFWCLAADGYTGFAVVLLPAMFVLSDGHLVGFAVFVGSGLTVNVGAFRFH